MSCGFTKWPCLMIKYSWTVGNILKENVCLEATLEYSSRRNDLLLWFHFLGFQWIIVIASFIMSWTIYSQDHICNLITHNCPISGIWNIRITFVLVLCRKVSLHTVSVYKETIYVKRHVAYGWDMNNWKCQTIHYGNTKGRETKFG